MNLDDIEETTAEPLPRSHDDCPNGVAGRAPRRCRAHNREDPQRPPLLRRGRSPGTERPPAVWHVDEVARAVVSVRVPGVPMAAALAAPAQRGPMLASVIDHLRLLHTLDPSGIGERAPLAYAHAAWEAARDRPGFPPWAASLAPILDAVAVLLDADPRRVVSHNDVNPMNVLRDGARAWLVDWEVTGLGHPYYDFAVLALFLRLEDDVALELVARHDGASLDERSRVTFRALRQLAGVLCGLTFLTRGLEGSDSSRTRPRRQGFRMRVRAPPDASRCPPVPGQPALRRG